MGYLVPKMNKNVSDFSRRPVAKRHTRNRIKMWTL